ncbi:hypothetical protein BJV82DRAFT_672331 [Fennellomyces sp. T-0311]|nr:hypothetical protein BJV82DRAFT_672331 [Fennellomyces sp. T-0311]
MVNCPQDYVGHFFTLASPMKRRQFFSKYPVDEWTFDSYLQDTLKRKANDLGQILHNYKEDLQWISSYSTLPDPIKGFATNLKKEIAAKPVNSFKEKYTRSISQDKPHVVINGPMLIGSKVHGSVHNFTSSEASGSGTGSTSNRSNDAPAEEQREGKQPQGETNEVSEEVTSLLATNDSAPLQPVTYHQKLTTWMFDLIHGKQTYAPRKKPVFADSSNAERLEHLTHGLLQSFSRNDDLDMCTLRQAT